MHDEYLRRNMLVAKAEGARSIAQTSIKRLLKMKRPPAWALAAFEAIEHRTASLPQDLAAWRNQADDAPEYVSPRVVKDAALTAAWRTLHDDAIPFSNRYVRAIKAHREACGSTLKEAKDAVDGLKDGSIRPPTTSKEPQRV